MAKHCFAQMRSFNILRIEHVDVGEPIVGHDLGCLQQKNC